MLRSPPRNGVGGRCDGAPQRSVIGVADLGDDRIRGPRDRQRIRPRHRSVLAMADDQDLCEACRSGARHSRRHRHCKGGDKPHKGIGDRIHGSCRIGGQATGRDRAEPLAARGSPRWPSGQGHCGQERGEHRQPPRSCGATRPAGPCSARSTGSNRPRKDTGRVVPLPIRRESNSMVRRHRVVRTQPPCAVTDWRTGCRATSTTSALTSPFP